MAGLLIGPAAGLARSQEVPADKPTAPAAELDAESGADAGLRDAAGAPVELDPSLVSPSVAAFYKLLPEVLELEMGAQAYEQKTLGAEDPEKLSGHRQRRRQRIDDDAAYFRTRVSQFALRPTKLPGSDDILAAGLSGRRLGADELALLSAVDEVYEVLTQPRRVEILNDLNRRFVEEGSWSARDEAIMLRVALMEDSRRFAAVSATAWQLLEEDIGEQALIELKAELGDLAPSVDLGTGNLGTLVIEDIQFRKQFLLELNDELGRRVANHAAPRDLETLEVARLEAQAAIAKQTGVLALLVEDSELAEELELIEDALAEEGVKKLDEDKRRVGEDRRADIFVRRAELEELWRRTQIPVPLFEEYVDTQLELLERRLIDLGPLGALFAHRRDAVHARRAELDPSLARLAWDYLDELDELQSAVAAAEPEPHPLDGFELGDVILMDPALRKQQAQILKLLQQATAAQEKAEKAKAKAAAKAAAKDKPGVR